DVGEGMVEGHSGTVASGRIDACIGRPVPPTDDVTEPGCQVLRGYIARTQSEPSRLAAYASRRTRDRGGRGNVVEGDRKGQTVAKRWRAVVGDSNGDLGGRGTIGWDPGEQAGIRVDCCAIRAERRRLIQCKHQLITDVRVGCKDWDK